MSMGRYEIIFILAPNTPEDTMSELIGRFESEVTTGGGVLLRAEMWGRKKLAYEVRKFREGFFVLFVVDCLGDLVMALERRFRMTDQVIKFLTVRIDEELKRAGKMPKDEEIGKPRETERIDRSRRSGVKPSLRTDSPAGAERKPVTAESGEKSAVPEKTVAAELTAADAVAEKPATETAEEPAAETAETPATETAEEPATETAEEPVAETAETPATETAEEPVAETAEPADNEGDADSADGDATEEK